MPEVGAHVCDHPTCFEPLFFLTPYLPPNAPKYSSSAFDVDPNGRVSQISMVGEQGFLTFAKLLGYDSTGLSLFLCSLLRLLYCLGIMLGWASSREPLSFGAIFATVCSPKTEYSLIFCEGKLTSTLPRLEPADVKHLADIMLRTRRIADRVRAEHEAQTRMGRTFVRFVYAVLRLLRLAPPQTCNDASALEEHVRRTCGTLWHPMGGAALGPVLDSRLRLRGTENVRVAGSAAFPAPVHVNPMATCYAMGWRLGELICA